MSILIHNSLTNKKDEFVPIAPGRVGMYVCGITAYDECHIGHARSAYVFDVIRKYFRYRGYDVKFVKNITDIDDKIIDRAREEAKGASVKEKASQIAERYTQRYHEDMRSLGIEPPDVEPRATEHIPDMLRAIEGLIAKDKAYLLSGDVYFNVRAHPGYGRLSGQKIDSTISGELKAQSKRDALDFALWKSAKPDEPSWDSPWGPGRPGWHIECSVMSTRYLGAHFDIHGGGRDLIFPHHENELAQSEALNQEPFASYWIHNGLLTINNQKMSKSLGNFIAIPDVLKNYSSEALKVFFLGAHYAHPIDFSYEKLDEAKSALSRFYIFFDKIEGFARAQRASADIEGFRASFINAMDDDFNAPGALAGLFGLLNQGNRFYDEGKADAAAALRDTLIELGAIFGLFGEKRKKESDAEIEAQIARRNEARQKRDFAAADAIRRHLFEQGIILEDTKDATRWRQAA